MCCFACCPSRDCGTRDEMKDAYLFLAIAVALEVVGTSALHATQQFTKIIPLIVMTIAYAGAFYFLSRTLSTMPVGIVYGIWSGLGIVLISIVGLVVFRQTLDLAAILGLAMIVAGVAVIHLFSKSATL